MPADLFQRDIAGIGALSNVPDKFIGFGGHRGVHSHAQVLRLFSGPPSDLAPIGAYGPRGAVWERPAALPDRRLISTIDQSCLLAWCGVAGASLWCQHPPTRV